MAEARAPDSPESGHSGGGDQAGEGRSGNGLREQDRFLPIANIGRIMRKGIPENGKIAKDAKESVQECVSEFISFVTSEASGKCQKEKRKTVNGDDLLWAMGTLGFEDYVGPLRMYLNMYREVLPSSSSLNLLSSHYLGTEFIGRTGELLIDLPFSSPPYPVCSALSVGQSPASDRCSGSSI
ncbi:unnamed protein product [Spirodela intermedia]|uniref:Transcription factor CBF/NF-Y/archaeal histone domain-containing protein n=2 Tax=Spirodela intermedia TaxID=51605 RepID=A0A7I8IV75_SPIIN|nr:unnamed protein product [Spirodela intermedia]CAA6661058.1 unnamed protein product [Spirodela intermedia]CAA7397415.1 unnamed protein product [Spirodela intermedia]